MMQYFVLRHTRYWMAALLCMVMCVTGGKALAQDAIQVPEAGAQLELSGQSAAAEALFLEDVGFFYKLDFGTRFLAERQAWEEKYTGRLNLEQLEELAWRAYHQADVESRFETWREQGGPNPLVFRPKVHLRNNTNRPWLEIQLQVVLRANVGEWLADPDLLLTDYDYLQSSAQWENVYVEEVSVAALAPGEEKLVECPPFQLFYFLQSHPNRWPLTLEVQTSIVQARGDSPALVNREPVDVQLPMIPDHFILPLESRRRLTQ